MGVSTDFTFTLTVRTSTYLKNVCCIVEKYPPNFDWQITYPNNKVLSVTRIQLSPKLDSRVSVVLISRYELIVGNIVCFCHII